MPRYITHTLATEVLMNQIPICQVIQCREVTHIYKMSPFSHLNLHRAYSRGIDGDFNPILHCIDELDRHFSNRHHHLMNCFIPRFDLEEDTRFYYFYGEIPGAKAEDITIEPHDSHTLVIYGTTHSPSSGHILPTLGGELINGNERSARPPTQAPSTGSTEEAKADITSDGNKPPLSLSPQNHNRHSPTSYIEPGSATKAPPRPEHKTLLSERLVGDFHRTFAFPMPVLEEAIRASIEDGVLSLLIPKKQKNDREEVKRVAIVQGD